MPLKPSSRFILQRRGSRYKVKEPGSKNVFSKKFMTRPRALQQMRALYAAAKRSGGALRARRAMARAAKMPKRQRTQRARPTDTSVQKMERALAQAGARRGAVRIIDGARGYGAEGMQALMNALLQQRVRSSRGVSPAELLHARERKTKDAMWKQIALGVAKSAAARSLQAMSGTLTRDMMKDGSGPIDIDYTR